MKLLQTCKSWLCAKISRLMMMVNLMTKESLELVGIQEIKPPPLRRWYEKAYEYNYCSYKTTKAELELVGSPSYSPRKWYEYESQHDLYNRMNAKKAATRFDDGKCSICLADPQIDKSFPPCGHVHCFECLTEWCEQKLECPTCKQSFCKFLHADGTMEFDATVFSKNFRKNLHVGMINLRRKERIEDCGSHLDGESKADTSYVASDFDFVLKDAPLWLKRGVNKYTSKNLHLHI